MNLDGFYDQMPVEIMLVGGLHDGKRILIPKDRDTWLMPLPVNITLLDPKPDVTRTSTPVAVYRWTGSIRDDGIRIFQVQPEIPWIVPYTPRSVT